MHEIQFCQHEEVDRRCILNVYTWRYQEDGQLRARLNLRNLIERQMKFMPGLKTGHEFSWKPICHLRKYRFYRNDIHSENQDLYYDIQKIEKIWENIQKMKKNPTECRRIF